MTVTRNAKEVMESLGGKWLINARDLISTLIDKKAEISGFEFASHSAEEFNAKVSGSPWVMVSFAAYPLGEGFLLLPKREAAVMVDLIIGGDGRVPSLEFSDLHLSILEESSSQIIKSFTSAFSAELGGNISPEIKQTLVNDFSALTFARVAQLGFQAKVEDLIEGEISFLFDADELESYIEGGAKKPEEAASPKAAPAPGKEEAASAPAPGPAPPPGKMRPRMEEPAEEEAEEYEEEDEEVEPPPRRKKLAHSAPAPRMKARKTRFMEEEYADENEEELEELEEPEVPAYTVHRLSVPALKHKPPTQKMGGIEFLMDINVKVTAVLGKTEILIKDLMEIGVGSVVQLDKFESEPVDLLVNNKLVARGEIVVVDEKFGIKVTETISDIDRVLRG